MANHNEVTMRGTLITGTNPNYDNVECLMAMLASLARNDAEQRVEVHLYNCALRVAIAASRVNPHAEICEHRTDYDGCDPATWTACARAWLLMKHLERRPDEPAAWIDTDVLIRGSLAPFWDLLGQNENHLVCTYRPDQPVKMRFASGFVGFTPGYSTMIMLRIWHEHTRMPDRWFADQIHLWRSYMICKSRGLMRMTALPAHIHDLEWGADSIVWHRRRINAQAARWLEEYNVYIEQAKDAARIIR